MTSRKAPSNTASKSTSKKKSASKKAPSFPFVGAGNATYFEWAEVHVRFARTPTAEEKNMIVAGVPPPLKDSIDWQSDDRHLMVASGQMAHMEIAAHYEADADGEGNDDDGDDDDDDDDDGLGGEGGRFFFAKASQVRRFNEHIERWLQEANAQCPIFAAYRAEDWESGGTKLSRWHKRSLEMMKDAQAELRAWVFGDDHAAYMARGVFEFLMAAGVDVEDAVADVVRPEAKYQRALDRADVDRLTQLLREGAPPGELFSKDAADAIQRCVNTMEPAHARALHGLLAHVDDVAPMGSLGRVLMRVAARTPTDAASARVLAKVAERAQADVTFAGEVAFHAYREVNASNMASALRLFAIAVVREDLTDTSAYCNALYAIQQDNGAPPQDPAFVRQVIERCLPHAPANPAIWFNAGFVFIELGDLDGAFRAFGLAKQHGKDLSSLPRERLLAPHLNDPRFRALMEA